MVPVFVVVDGFELVVDLTVVLTVVFVVVLTVDEEA